MKKIALLVTLVLSFSLHGNDIDIKRELERQVDLACFIIAPGNLQSDSIPEEMIEWFQSLYRACGSCKQVKQAFAKYQERYPELFNQEPEENPYIRSQSVRALMYELFGKMQSESAQNDESFNEFMTENRK